MRPCAAVRAFSETRNRRFPDRRRLPVRDPRAAALFGVLGVEKVDPLVWPSWWAALIQTVGGALVMIGLGTRYAALLCSGSMAYAYFTVHQASAFLPVQNGGEKAALFCFAFLLIAFLGNGAWSVQRAARVPAQTTAAE